MSKYVTIKNRMKYFRVKYLLVFLTLNGINLLLNSIWTSDKGWMPLMTLVVGVFSVLFWFIISLISFLKKTHLKNGIYYYIGLGIWGIILTIEYFKLQFIDRSISNTLELTPFAIIILICLLPIKPIWEKE